MITKSKSVRLVVMTAFLLNMVFQDTSRAQTGMISSDNLSPVLKCNDLLGIEHKDHFRIQFALKPHLEEVNSSIDVRGSADLQTFKKKLGYTARKENTIFYPTELQFFYNEAEYLSNGDIVVMCRIVDQDKAGDYSKTERTRTYYLVFYLSEDENKHEFVFKSIYSEEEFEKVKGELQLLSGRDGKDKEAVERYAVHESVIDDFIRERIEAGDFLEIEGRRKELGWDNKFPDAIEPRRSDILPASLWKFIKLLYLDRFLGYFGSGTAKALAGKNLVFIRIPAEVDLPRIKLKVNAEGRDVGPGEDGIYIELEVSAHTSKNAVYVFLEEEVIDDLYSERIDEQGKVQYITNLNVLQERIMPHIIHEIGVIYGLKYFVKDREIKNDLDRAWEQFTVELALKGITLDVIRDMCKDLVKLSAGPIDIDTELEQRDYLMGKIRKVRPQVHQRKTPSQKLDKKIIDAYKSIARANPGSSGGRQRGITAVNNFLRLIAQKAEKEMDVSSGRILAGSSRQGFTVLMDIMNSEWFRSVVNKESFRRMFNTESLSNFANNVWNAFEYYLSQDDSFTAFDPEAQKILYLLSNIDSFLEKENAIRSQDDLIGSDYGSFYQTMYALVYNGINVNKVVKIFEDSGIAASKIISTMRARDVNKLKQRMEKNSDGKIKELISSMEKDGTESVEKFLETLKKKAARSGYRDGDVDNIVITAAAGTPDVLVSQIKIVCQEERSLRVYLDSLDPAELKINTSPELIEHLRGKRSELGFKAGFLMEKVLDLASSDIGDLAYIDAAISAQSYMDETFGEYVRKTKNKVNDFKTLEKAAGILSYLSKSSYVELFMFASMLKVLESSEGLKPGAYKNKRDFISGVADKIYGQGKGLSSLVKVLGDEMTIDELIGMVAAFVGAFVTLNMKRGEYSRAATVAERYLSFLSALEDSENNEKEKEIFIDLLNEIYVNNIAYNINGIYRLQANVPMSDKSIQDRFLEVVEIDKKRKQLWDEARQPLPVGVIGLRQVLYSLIHIIPGYKEGSEDHYGRVAEFFEGRDMREFMTAVEEDPSKQISLADFFEPYLYAAALDEDRLKQMERTDKSLLDHSMTKLFGEEDGREALAKIFPDRDILVKREKDFIRFINNMQIYYYQRAQGNDVIKVLKQFSRYMSHQLRTIDDKELMRDVFSEDVQAELYLLSSAADTEHIDELFEQEKPFIEYFMDKLYGEGEGQRAAEDILGEENIIRIEKELFSIFQIMHAEGYKIKNFSETAKIREIYEKYLMHQKNSYTGAYSIKDIMTRDDLTFHYYSLLLSAPDMEDVLASGSNFMDTAGEKLFGKDEASMASLNILQAGLKNGQSLRDPNYGFIDMYDDYIAKALEKKDKDIVLGTLDLFMKYAVHQKKHSEGIQKVYFEKVESGLENVKNKFQKILAGSSGTEDFFSGALKIWKEAEVSRKQIFESVRTVEQVTVETIEEDKTKEHSVEVIPAEQVKTEIEKAGLFRERMNREIVLAQSKLDLARQHLTPEDARIASEAVVEITGIMNGIESYVLAEKQGLRNLDPAIKTVKRGNIKEIEAGVRSLSKALVQVKRSVAEIERKSREAASVIEAENVKLRLLMETEYRELLERREHIEKVIDKMYDISAEGLDHIAEQRLLEADNRLKELDENMNEVNAYIDELRDRVGSLPEEWRQKFSSERDHMEARKKEVMEEAVITLGSLLEIEKKEESKDLEHKWEQAENGIEELKGVFSLIRRHIEEMKVPEAEALYAGITDEEQDLYRYISIIQRKVRDNGRKDLKPLLAKAVEIKRKEIDVPVETLGADLEKAKAIFEKAEAIRRREEEVIREEQEKENAKIRETEREKLAYASGKVLELEDKVSRAMDHAKGIILNIAESILDRVDKFIAPVEEYRKEVAGKFLVSTGERRSELSGDMDALKDLEERAHSTVEKLSARVEAEKDILKKEADKEAAINHELQEAAFLMDDAETAIESWKFDSSAESVAKTRDIIERVSEYIYSVSEAARNSVSARKKQLQRAVFRIKRTNVALEDRVNTVQIKIEQEKEKAAAVFIDKERAEQYGASIFSDSLEVIKLAKEARIVEAGVILDRVKGDLESMAGIISSFNEMLKGKLSEGKRAWLNRSMSELETLVMIARDKALYAENTFLKEKTEIRSEREAFDSVKNVIESVILEAGEAISRIKQGTGGTGELIKADLEEARNKALEYILENDSLLKKDIQITGSHKRKRVSSYSDRIGGLLSVAERSLSEIGRAMAAALEEAGKDEENRDDALKSLDRAKENIEKGLAALNSGELEDAKILRHNAETELFPVRKYLKELGETDVSGKRKLMISKNKLEVSRKLERLEKRSDELQRGIVDLEEDIFLADIKSFSEYALEVCSGGDGPLSVSFDDDISGIDKNFNYIEYFRRGALADNYSGLIGFNAAVNSLIALMDLEGASAKKVNKFNEMLHDSRCSDDHKALIYVTFYRHGIEQTENYKLITEMLKDPPSVRTEIVLRSFFLEKGKEADRQVEWLNNVLLMDDDAFKEAGLMYIDEARISAALMQAGVETEENLEWFKALVNVLKDQRSQGQIDSELEALVFHSLVKYFLTVRKGLIDEVASAGKNAAKSGLEIPTNINDRFTLIVPGDLFNNGDLEKYKRDYYERFDIRTVGARSGRKFVNKVFSLVSAHNNDPDRKYDINNDRIVVLIPSNVPQEQLKMLIDKNVRFIRITPESLYSAKTGEESERERFHRNTFAIMILSRILDKDKIDEPYMRRLFELYEFYIKSHFDLDGVTPEGFARAVAGGDLAVLVKGLLMFKPMEKYASPEYDKVQETLIFA